MVQNKDPFEDVIAADNNDPFKKVVFQRKNATQTATPKFNRCQEAAKKIATEMRTVGSPLHKIVSDEIRNGVEEQQLISKELIPKNLYNHFRILSQCWWNKNTGNPDERYPYGVKIANKEFEKISKYATVYGHVGYDGKVDWQKSRAKFSLVIDTSAERSTNAEPAISYEYY